MSDLTPIVAANPKNEPTFVRRLKLFTRSIQTSFAYPLSRQADLTFGPRRAPADPI